MAKNQEFLASRGLNLPKSALRQLEIVGIFAKAQVSLEHQHLAGRYVVRGIESGGAVKDLGRYVTFCGPTGEQLPCLHPIDCVGVNGVHAVVIATVFVRIELFRSGRTCQLLITRHQPGSAETGRRPGMVNAVVFRGVNGLIEPRKGEKAMDVGGFIPRFWTRSGEGHEVPQVFGAAVEAATRGASCIGCCHSHFLAPPNGVVAPFRP